MDAILTATRKRRGPARLGRPKVGAVAAGYYADVIAVSGDPARRSDRARAGLRFVMKRAERSSSPEPLEHRRKV